MILRLNIMKFYEAREKNKPVEAELIFIEPTLFTICNWRNNIGIDAVINKVTNGCSESDVFVEISCEAGECMKIRAREFKSVFWNYGERALTSN